MIPPIRPVTGGEDGGAPGDSDSSITEEQSVTLRDLAERAGEPYDGNLSERQAQERIGVLRDRLGDGG